MKVQKQYSSQYFGAKLVAKSKIKENIPFTPFFKKIDAYVVEVEQDKDISCIKDYVRNDLYNQFGHNILRDIQESRCFDRYRVFALTRQKNNYKDLKPNEIIGVCAGSHSYDWLNGNVFFIHTLETKSMNNRCRPLDKKKISILGLTFNVPLKLKGLSKALLKSIINLDADAINTIELQTSPFAKSFYKHLGFVSDYTDPDYLRMSIDKLNEVI